MNLNDILTTLIIMSFSGILFCILAYIRNELTLKIHKKWNLKVFEYRYKLVYEMCMEDNKLAKNIYDEISYEEMSSALYDYDKMFNSLLRWREEDLVVNKTLYTIVCNQYGLLNKSAAAINTELSKQNYQNF